MRKIVMVVKIGYEDQFEAGRKWEYKTVHMQTEDQDDVELLENVFDDAEDAVHNLRGDE